MDFRDIIQAEITAKRKILQERKSQSKYIRRGDLQSVPKSESTKDTDDANDAGSLTEEAGVQSPASATVVESTAGALERAVEAADDEEAVKLVKDAVPRPNSPSLKTDQLLLRSAMETEPITASLLKSDPNKLRSLISLFIKRLLREQAEWLTLRSEEERQSKQGKLDSTIHSQCQEHLKPFFRLIRKNLLPADVLSSLAVICGLLQEREYIKANDIYLRLAIGNAPWPIGVTAVGIHERSAQEKIKSNQVAHVLNDEVSRKWIQAVKRLMTFCQRAWDDVVKASDIVKALGDVEALNDFKALDDIDTLANAKASDGFEALDDACLLKQQAL